MSSYFADSDQFGGDSPSAGVTHSLDDGHLGPESFSNFDSDAANSSPPIFVSGGEFPSDGPILPPSAEMGPEESYALREWRRQNGIRLEEKEKREKELLSQIITEAEEYKNEFHKKRQVTCETNRATNREKEKAFLASLEKFHAEANKDYWKSIAELIPKEVPEIKKKGKKEQEKKPTIYAVQGPKPGKPTDLARMRQILVKLKHNAPPHLKLSPRQAPDATAPKAPDAAAFTGAVAVA